MKDHISVCIPTFRRNRMLDRLIRKLAVQEGEELFNLSVVVVDNDATGPARGTVEQLCQSLGVDIAYAIEPDQTIPAARNHALRLSRGNYVAIIDDDEFPPRSWLANLYNAVQTFDVNGALGPVIPFFDKQPPDWLLKSKLCERPILRTGTLLRWNQTRTGNVLLKREVFDKHDLRFDETFRTGGSDQAFFRAAMQKGYRFVACAEAPVYEVVPPERWAETYYIRRAIVNGFNTYNYASGSSRFIAPFKSACAIVGYALLLPIFFFWGKHRVIPCLEKGSYHLSRFLAAFRIELLKRRNF